MTPRAPAPDFTGFSAEGLQFMRDLAANNTREWFEARKPAYIDTVQTPAVALVAALGARLQDLVPDVTVDTRTNGSGNLMRLHRDTRFSADKAGKTHVPMMFPVGGKKMDSPGFGLQITLDGVDCMAGVFGFDKGALARYRDAVAGDEHGPALVKAVDAVRKAGQPPPSTARASSAFRLATIPTTRAPNGCATAGCTRRSTDCRRTSRGLPGSSTC
ncbi:MAG: DUF2461 family protein [Chloroflexi bacterium]|nr:DUF2461 family protein [Chloroflexota bacterium]